MIEGEAVPPHHVLARYCKRLQVVDGVVLGDAFMLEGTHEYHSVTSIDDVAPGLGQRDQVLAAKAAITASGLTLKPNGWFALIRNEVLTRPLTDDGSGAHVELETLGQPVDGNASHCGIHGLPPVGSAHATGVALEISERITELVYRASDVTPVLRGA